MGKLVSENYELIFAELQLRLESFQGLGQPNHQGDAFAATGTFQHFVPLTFAAGGVAFLAGIVSTLFAFKYKTRTNNHPSSARDSDDEAEEDSEAPSHLLDYPPLSRTSFNGSMPSEVFKTFPDASVAYISTNESALFQTQSMLGPWSTSTDGIDSLDYASEPEHDLSDRVISIEMLDEFEGNLHSAK
eukprot:CAMPEP_0116860296 /NCGR_PEP_ID=MMETSP0418-20121206/22327_1 /TAXON_ID=1158023 /ORGANISM="Astrosyne radiata, Strain 13vi08-1A" /LENGTH=187 /DNA_ID=CAMNT_0004494669 /DNA_START=93 /DNA_END=656 /DNA_ORIENTATION=-